MLIRNSFLILLIMAHSFVGAQTKKIIAETSLDNVTIFAAGARLERTASVSLLAGRTKISFPGLSNQLDPQSVQLKADANITLLSVQSGKDFLSARKIDEEEMSFLENIQSLQDKLAYDRKLLDVYKREEEMLAKNEAIGGQSGVKTAELKEALDLHRKRLTEVYEKQLEIQKQINTRVKELERFKEQSREISKKKDSINYIVTVLVETKETRKVSLKLLYNIKDAGWYTTYDVRVKEITDPLAVLMNANVFQRSGETWKNVSVSLSTGNPTDNATPGKLYPWFLDYYVRGMPSNNQHSGGIVSGRVANTKGEPINGASIVIKNSTLGTSTDGNGFFKIENPQNSALVVSAVGYQSKEVISKGGYFTIILEESRQNLEEIVVVGYGTQKKAALVGSENLKQKAPGMETVTVNTQYQPTTTVYEIKDKYTLETDGKTTTIGIMNIDIPAMYHYYTVPKVDPSAFLIADIVHWQDFDLQSGEASLYYEGNYLGKTYIDLGAEADTLTLSLGKDNGVKISRKLVKEFSSKRFIGSNKTDSKSFEITLRNTKKVPVDITINDQFPVSTNKEISVEDLKAAGAAIDKETGMITWSVHLKPGEEKKLIKSYSVKYPKDKQVNLE